MAARSWILGASYTLVLHDVRSRDKGDAGGHKGPYGTRPSSLYLRLMPIGHPLRSKRVWGTLSHVQRAMFDGYCNIRKARHLRLTGSC